MALFPSSIINPCPICEDFSGKCRQGKQDESYWQCMTYADSKKCEVVNGFKCIGQISNGLWSAFKPDNSQDWSEQQRLEWQRENQQRQQKKAKEQEKLAKDALPIEERDRAIRKLHKYFGLSAHHREDLHRRGLSDEVIETNLYFSVTPNQKVPYGIPKNLPGIKFGEIRAGGTGYACVSFEPHGKATGWQVRIDGATDNKYRWAKGESPSHLKNGELPITSAYPVGELKRSFIGICEGINKATIAANRLGEIFIGAASANFAASPQQLEEALKVASSHLGGTKRVEWAADAGSVNNPHILKAYQRSWDLLKQLGYEVRVLWWGQIDKSSPDIDELQDPSLIQSISIEEFLCKVTSHLQSNQGFSNCGKEENTIPLNTSQTDGDGNTYAKQESHYPSTQNLDTAQSKCFNQFPTANTAESKSSNQVKDLEHLKKTRNNKKDKTPRLGFNSLKEDNPEFEEKIRQVQRKLRSLSYKPDIEVSERYLPSELVNQLPKSGLIGIKAPKGCGKSVFLKNIIALTKTQKIPVLSITPRIALGREQATKWEITWIDDYGVMKTRAEDTTNQIREIAQKRDKARGGISRIRGNIPSTIKLIRQLRD